MRFLLLLLAAATLASCSKKIQVESDTSWEGTVNGANVTGTGNQVYELSGDTNCYSFRKLTPEGYLRVKIKKGSGMSQEADSLGVVQGCID